MSASIPLHALVHEPITFKNVEDVVHSIVVALSEHGAVIARSQSEKRLEKLEKAIADLQSASPSADVKRLQQKHSEERSIWTHERAELNAKVAAMAASIDQLSARLGAIESLATAPGSPGSPGSPGLGVADEDGLGSRSTVSARGENAELLAAMNAGIEAARRMAERARSELESHKAAARDAHDELHGEMSQLRMQMAGSEGGGAVRVALDALGARCEALSDSLKRLNTRKAEREELTAAVRQLETRIQVGAIEARQAELAASSATAGGVRVPAGDAAPTSDAATAAATAAALEGPTRRALHEVELLRQAQAQGSEAVITLQRQVAALERGVNQKIERWKHAAAMSAQPAASAALSAEQLAELSAALGPKLEDLERRVVALAHSKADAHKVEAALEEKADAAMLLDKVDRAFCETLIARLSTELVGKLGAVETSQTTLRAQLETELAEAVRRNESALAHGQDEARRRAAAEARDGPTVLQGDEQFAVLWVSRLAGAPNRPQGAVKAEPHWRKPARPQSAPGTRGEPRARASPERERERAATAVAQAVTEEEEASAAGGGGARPRARPHSARPVSGRAPLGATLFNDRVSGGKGDGAEAALTGQMVGRKLRAHQTAGGHFNGAAGRDASPPHERIALTEPAPPLSQQQPPQPRRSAGAHGGAGAAEAHLTEAERLRARAREARERALRGMQRMQPTNGPPVRTGGAERARLAAFSSAASVRSSSTTVSQLLGAEGGGGSGPNLNVLGKDGTFYTFSAGGERILPAQR